MNFRYLLSMCLKKMLRFSAIYLIFWGPELFRPKKTGTFTGIFAGGFVEYLGAQRQLERQQAKDERLRVMAMVDAWAKVEGKVLASGCRWWRWIDVNDWLTNHGHMIVDHMYCRTWFLDMRSYGFWNINDRAFMAWMIWMYMMYQKDVLLRVCVSCLQFESWCSVLAQPRRSDPSWYANDLKDYCHFLDSGIPTNFCVQQFAEDTQNVSWRHHTVMFPGSWN